MEFLKRVLPLIGVCLFIYLIVKIGVKEIFTKIITANPFYIILGLFFIIPIVFFQTLKWYSILQRQKIKITFTEAVKLQLISMFYGAITPARVGSFIKIAYLQDRLKNFGKAASSVFIDRAFDMLTVLLFAGMGTLILINQIPQMALFVFVVFIAFMIFFMLLISKNNGQKIVRFLYEKLLPKSIKKRTRKSFKDFYLSIPKKRQLVIPFLLNIAAWIVIYTQIFIVAKAINVKVPYFVIIFMFPIATIIGEIPVSVGGLGIREASLIGLLGLFGIAADSVMSISIISLVITNIIPSVTGMILAATGYSINKRAKKKK